MVMLRSSAGARSSSMTPSTTSATDVVMPGTGRAPACANANRSSTSARARLRLRLPRAASAIIRSLPAAPRSVAASDISAAEIGFSRSCATRPAKPSSSSDRRRTIASLRAIVFNASNASAIASATLTPSRPNTQNARVLALAFDHVGHLGHARRVQLDVRHDRVGLVVDRVRQLVDQQLLRRHDSGRSPWPA